MRRKLLLSSAGILAAALVLGYLGLSDGRKPGSQPAPSSQTEELDAAKDARLEPRGSAELAVDHVDRREAEGSSPGTAKLIVRTLDIAGHPLAGATVLVGNEAAGTTDPAGEIAIWKSRAERALYVGAVAEGMGPAYRTLYRPIPDRVELRLSEACRISGTLVARGSRFPPSGALVAAWPLGHEPSQEEVERRLASPRPQAWEELRVVAPDAEGAFEIDGLAEGLSYVLTAAAPGWAAERRVAVQRACGASSTTLVLRPLYGALLDLADEAGEPLAVSPEILTRMSWGLGEQGNGEGLPGEAVEAALAGLTLSQARSEGLRPFLALADQELPRVGPVHLSCSAFGYELGKLQVWLERGSESLPVHPARLTAEGHAWGTLTVRIEGLPAPCRPSGASAGNPLRIWLQPEAGEERIAHLDLKDGATPLRVPQGRYIVRLTLSGNLYARPGQAVDVGDSSEVVFSLADLGCIDLQPDFGAGDSGHAGLGVQVQAEGAPEESGVALFLEGPPYLLSGLPPGPYQVQVTFPDRQGFEPAAVEVQAGSLNVLRVPRAD